MNKHIIVILLTAVLLITSTFPAAAGNPQQIPVTGYCWIVGWVGEGGTLTPDPDYRYWVAENGYVTHWRNQLWLLQCDYSDDRLDGYMLVSDNWNMVWDEDYIAHTFSKVWSADVNGNILDIWEGSIEGYLDWNWMTTSKTVLHGRGIYQGLHAYIISSGYGDYPQEGMLFIPGK